MLYTHEETIKHFLWIGLTLGILFSLGINISETHLIIQAFEPLAAQLNVPNWALMKQYLLIADLLFTLGLFMAAYFSRGVVGVIGALLIVAGGYLLPFSGSFTVVGVILVFFGAGLLKAG